MTATPSATTTREAETTRKFVEDIFSHAIYHDREIERQKAAIEEHLRIGDREIDTLLADWRLEIAGVCAAVAPLAVRRAAAMAEATGGRYGQVIGDMNGPEETEYARELFEESGIGERFVP